MSDLILNEPRLIREKMILENLVLVDGQPGCGKTLFTAIIAAMNRVELLNYSPELENICALKYLKKITDDAVEAMIRIQMDLVIYETMMSRSTNFRPSDLSSAFRNVNVVTYLKRLFVKGDEVIPELIKREKPILHFATHNLLAFCEPVFKALGKKVVVIEIVRHPLYMLIQQTLNRERHMDSSGAARQFHLYIKYREHQLPFKNFGQEELYLRSNPVERAIYEMQKTTELTETFKNKYQNQYNSQILTIPFEPFVLDPWPYLKKIEKLMKSRITRKTRKVIKKQKVPRKKISDGIPLAIYKRCGWEAPDSNMTEEEELDKRRQFAIDNGASEEAISVLDQLCKNYEKDYFRF
tara:strand:+ start:18353 stop:19411 length:1059 start_codon:yes stop_codon:yes gene_type:complete